MFGWFNKDTEESLREEYKRLVSMRDASFNDWHEIKSMDLPDDPFEKERLVMQREIAWESLGIITDSLYNIEKRIKKYVRKHG